MLKILVKSTKLCCTNGDGGSSKAKLWKDVIFGRYDINPFSLQDRRSMLKDICGI